jgi:hypothetical protein
MIHRQSAIDGQDWWRPFENLTLIFLSLYRHTVAKALEAAAVSQTDAARMLGHTVAGMSYGVYSSGPGLKRMAGVIEAFKLNNALTRAVSWRRPADRSDIFSAARFVLPFLIETSATMNASASE